MRLLLLLTLFFFATTTTGCETLSSNPPLPTAASVDLPKFMGKWYVIANLPLPLEGDLVNATETYTWNAEKQRIDVLYRGHKKTPDGDVKEFPQKAFVHNKETNAEWRVQFFWPLKFPYLILDVDSDYSSTMVGVPNRKYLWIMSRKTTMDAASYERLVAKAKVQGFEVGRLKRVLQLWQNSNAE